MVTMFRESSKSSGSHIFSVLKPRLPYGLAGHKSWVLNTITSDRFLTPYNLTKADTYVSVVPSTRNSFDHCPG